MTIKLNHLPENYRPIIERQMRELLPPISQIDWLGSGPVRVTFAEQQEDLNSYESFQRFAPYIMNWSATFRDPIRRVFLYVPAAIRNAAMQEAQRD